jgi:hypothetical protein
MDGALFDHGTISYENFGKAHAFATVVLANADSSAELINGAYWMLYAANEALLIKNQADLNLLIAEWRPTFETDNALNGDGDTRWYDTSWGNFVTAFDNATFNTFDNTNVVTDLWVDLTVAAGGLEVKPTITKQQSAALIRAADTVATTRSLHVDERRGASAGVAWHAAEWDPPVNNCTGCSQWGGAALEWGALWDTTPGAVRLGHPPWNAADGLAAPLPNSWTAPADIASDGNAQWCASRRICVNGVHVIGGFDAAYAAFAGETGRYRDFGNYQASTTSNDDIVGAYFALEAMVTAIRGFSADNTGSAGAANFRTIINTYHNIIVDADNHRRQVVASPSTLAAVRNNPNQLGNGALSNLYSVIAAQTGIAWVDQGGGTTGNLVFAGDQFSIIRDLDTNAFVKAEAGNNASFDAGTQRRSVYNKGSRPDLRRYVAVDATVAAGGAQNVIIGASHLNGLFGGGTTTIDGTTRVSFSQLYLIANRIIENTADSLGGLYDFTYQNWAGNEVDLNDAAKRAQIFRIFRYTHENLPGGTLNLQTKRTLENAIEASYFYDDLMIPSFATELQRVVNARRAALPVVSQIFTRVDIADLVDQMAYFTAWSNLNAATGAYDAKLANYPHSVQQALDLMFEKADDPGAIEYIIALAYGMLTYPLGDDDIWDSAGELLVTERLRNGTRALAAYRALFLRDDDDAYRKGDVNGDGQITPADALEVLKFAVGLESHIDGNAAAFRAGSITSDSPTTACALEILKVAIGIESEYFA